MMITSKRCRCGMSVKDVRCSAEYLCERKCTTVRNCKRHKCKKKCCDGNCPPCSEVCGKKLNCANHTCEMPCHDGPCFPCVQTVALMCCCGHQKRVVPCGMERTTPNPACTRMCAMPPYCRHPAREPHHCHYGPCPPCKRPCDTPLGTCEHSCTYPCHDPLPPCPFKKKRDLEKLRFPPPSQFNWENRSPCPDCPVPVQRQCKGLHETRTVVCSSQPFVCDRLCGRLLPCTNHTCHLPCHPVEEDAQPEESADVEGEVAGSKDGEEPWEDEYEETEEEDSEPYECVPCTRACEKPRTCKHPCELQCHPGPCPPCNVSVNIRCFCPSRALKRMACHVLQQPAEVTEPLIACGQVCGRQLRACTHTCAAACHAGDCPENSTLCDKKVKVTCSCGVMKKTVQCVEAQALRQQCGMSAVDATKILPCGDACEARKLQRRQASTAPEPVKEEPKEIQDSERKTRGRRKGQNQTAPPTGRNHELYVWLAVLVVVVALICALVVLQPTLG